VVSAKQAKLRLRKSTALYIHGDDRPGAIADILGKLAGARISVAAVQAVCAGGGSYGTIVFLPPAAARKAASVLSA
jgi:predicted amino acid-binding ACT domain protein